MSREHVVARRCLAIPTSLYTVIECSSDLGRGHLERGLTQLGFGVPHNLLQIFDLRVEAHVRLSALDACIRGDHLLLNVLLELRVGVPIEVRR